MNIVILVGKALENSVIKRNKSGIEYTEIRIVIPRKDANGNKVNEIIGVYFWGQRAKYIEEYVHKDDIITVEGRVSAKDESSYVINGVRIQKQVNSKVKEKEEKANDLRF